MEKIIEPDCEVCGVKTTLEYRRSSGMDIEPTGLFSKCLVKPQSEVGGMDDRYVYLALSKDLYERWNKQIDTPYSELSESEKESDRKETRNYLPLIKQVESHLIERIRKEIVGRIVDFTENKSGIGELEKQVRFGLEEALDLPSLNQTQEKQ